MVMSQQSKIIKLAIIFPAIICVIFTLWTLLWLWSSILTIAPEAIITEWEQSYTKEINQPIALEMLEQLKISIIINPFDANSHLLLARYYEALTYNKRAEKAYINATAYQPSWDYAWARKANFYSNLPKLNPNIFMHALSKAMLLGAYETKNQHVIVPLIFKHWSLLSNNKAQAIKIIKHSLKFHTYATFVLQAANKYQHLATISPLITKKWQKNQLKKYLEETKNDK
jgi:hypothetical protein